MCTWSTRKARYGVPARSGALPNSGATSPYGVQVPSGAPAPYGARVALGVISPSGVQTRFGAPLRFGVRTGLWPARRKRSALTGRIEIVILDADECWPAWGGFGRPPFRRKTSHWLAHAASPPNVEGIGSRDVILL